MLSFLLLALCTSTETPLNTLPRASFPCAEAGMEGGTPEFDHARERWFQGGHLPGALWSKQERGSRHEPEHCLIPVPMCLNTANRAVFSVTVAYSYTRARAHTHTHAFTDSGRLSVQQAQVGSGCAPCAACACDRSCWTCAHFNCHSGNHA